MGEKSELVADGDFATSGPWTALRRSEKYADQLASLPVTTNAIFTRTTKQHVLAMNLSKDVAESNGIRLPVGCDSDRADG